MVWNPKSKKWDLLSSGKECLLLLYFIIEIILLIRVQKLKENIQFSMDKTMVSYTERKVYTFNEIMSIGSIEDNLTVINLQFMVNYKTLHSNK